jgi:hypothetical protein
MARFRRLDFLPGAARGRLSVACNNKIPRRNEMEVVLMAFGFLIVIWAVVILGSGFFNRNIK